MRALIHKILSGFPALLIALLALVATADLKSFLKYYKTCAQWLQSDSNLQACIALIVIYAVLWLITGLTPKSRREKIKEGLRPYYTSTAELTNELKRVSTDIDAINLFKRIDEQQAVVGSWLTSNMGSAAVQKLITVDGSASFWTWPGEHDAELSEKRSRVLSTMTGRVRNLEELLEHDKWDGPVPGFRARAALRMKRVQKALTRKQSTDI